MEPMFSPRKVAGMLQQQLIDTLYALQQRILIVERFGENAVTMPMLGRIGTEKLPEMLARHDELVRQITTIQNARDKASEIEILEFVKNLKGGAR